MGELGWLGGGEGWWGVGSVYEKINIYNSPNKDFSQGRGSYFCFIIIPHDSRIAGCQPTCLDLPRLA